MFACHNYVLLCGTFSWNSLVLHPSVLIHDNPVGVGRLSSLANSFLVLDFITPCDRSLLTNPVTLFLMFLDTSSAHLRLIFIWYLKSFLVIAVCSHVYVRIRRKKNVISLILWPKYSPLFYHMRGNKQLLMAMVRLLCFLNDDL